MKIAVWGPYPKHEIARTVASAVLDGLEASGNPATIYLDADEVFYDADVHIGYGILRGIGDVFHEARKRNQAFVLIDNGYWKPGHYDGYYRISLNGTQQTTGLDKLEPDYDRWDALGLEILPYKHRDFPLRMMACPPTDYVRSFFGNDCWPTKWPEDLYLVRTKETKRLLQEDLDNTRAVTTFNSSVAWEALRQGIPVVSDPNHSIIGSYMKHVDTMSQMTIDNRRRLFSLMASLQLTLEEIRSGKLWPLIQRLLSTSDGMPAKQ